MSTQDNGSGMRQFNSEFITWEKAQRTELYVSSDLLQDSEARRLMDLMLDEHELSSGSQDQPATSSKSPNPDSSPTSDDSSDDASNSSMNQS